MLSRRLKTFIKNESSKVSKCITSSGAKASLLKRRHKWKSPCCSFYLKKKKRVRLRTLTKEINKEKKKGDVGNLIVSNKVTTLKKKNEEFPYTGLDLVYNNEDIYFGLTMKGGGLSSFWFINFLVLDCGIGNFLGFLLHLFMQICP